MPYEKNKTVYQDDEWFEREQRNILDVNRWKDRCLEKPFIQSVMTIKIFTRKFALRTTGLLMVNLMQC